MCCTKALKVCIVQHLHCMVDASRCTMHPDAGVMLQMHCTMQPMSGMKFELCSLNRATSFIQYFALHNMLVSRDETWLFDCDRQSETQNALYNVLPEWIELYALHNMISTRDKTWLLDGGTQTENKSQGSIEQVARFYSPTVSLSVQF